MLKRANSGKTKNQKLTPLMRQYWDIKSVHEDKILLFRMGDFFEMFFEDAVIAAPILNIALTSRNKKSGDETPMCGMPHHSIAGPIQKLLQAGHRIAICDQIEDPKEAKGLVKRAVTRILSPGMVYDPETLDQLESNYLCSFDDQTVAYFEPTTGESFYFQTEELESAEKLLNVLRPVEIVLSEKQKQGLELNLAPGELQGICLSVFEPEKTLSPEGSKAAQVLTEYVRHMQGDFHNGQPIVFEKRPLAGCVPLSSTVLRHLEVFETYKGEDQGSLFHALKRTKTSAGGRLLKHWIRFPLTDIDKVNHRLDQVEAWTKKIDLLTKVRKSLAHMGDVERRIGKISNPSCNARDLRSLSQSLKIGQEVSQWTDTLKSSDLQLLEKMVETVDSFLVEEPPISLKEGGLIKKQVSKDLDELILLTEESHQLLVELEAREKQSTGISSLKVRYNNVFGYYIEVTKTHTSKVPDHYKRKQTLTNAERYVTQELHELEGKILSAKSKRSELEYELFCQLQNRVLSRTSDLVRFAKVWSELDVVGSLAWLAMEENYCRPQFSDSRLKLESSRHPVVEQEMSNRFVPNHLVLEKGEALLLTGPNMAGKSTLMRQVAIAAIMGQMGSFVPAQKAELPLFNKVFTRIGASDFLNEGLSTFMVEMKETAEMLKSSGPRTLVILDEIGRGTSTYDGMTLAQSILEYLVQNRGCITLFATHYHELTDLDKVIPKIKNGHMAVKEEDDHIQFLHTLRSGPANKSYGIQVGELAGLPKTVTDRAKSLLIELEEKEPVQQQLSFGVNAFEERVSDHQLDSSQEDLLEKIKTLPVQEMTPLEALNKIAQWQTELS